MTITVNNYHPGSYVPGEVIMIDVTLEDSDATFLSATFQLYTSNKLTEAYLSTRVSTQGAILTQKQANNSISGTLFFVLNKENIKKNNEGYTLVLTLSSYVDENNTEIPIVQFLINTVENNTPISYYSNNYYAILLNATYHVPSTLFNVKRKSIGIGCLARSQPRIIRFNNGIVKTGFYPVGALYCSVRNVNPATYFGGTWELYCPGRTLVGVDEEDEDFANAANDWTKGTREETLTIQTIPSHRHDWNSSNRAANGTNYARMRAHGYVSTTGYATSYVGGGQPHNNLQPYITCYIWVRTS